MSEICSNCKSSVCTLCDRYKRRILNIKKGKEDTFLGLTNVDSKEVVIGRRNRFIFQIVKRLKDVKDSEVPMKNVSAHELEIKINNVLNSLGLKGGLGKCNDYLEFNFPSNKEKVKLFQLFSEIKMKKKKRFNIDWCDVYNGR